ncbi:MAG: CoA ester lyase, partial [Mesorhizobium sp.]
GKGAAALDGKMIDAASERMARNVLVVSEAIERAGQAQAAAH